MDKFGQGLEFRCSKLDQNKELNLTGFTKQMLLEMCILSGCDYLQSLPGMGLKKAHALIKKFKSYDKVNIIGALKMLTSLEKFVCSIVICQSLILLPRFNLLILSIDLHLVLSIYISMIIGY